LSVILFIMMFRALTYKTGNRDYRSWDVNTIIFFLLL